VWPLLTPLLFGRFRKYRGIAVKLLGGTIAENIKSTETGIELLFWDEFLRLSEDS
jgi:hypothetical protein